MKGIFISFEGIEGTGKSTLTGMLSEHLTSKGYRVVRTAEPGGARISQKIRELLLSLDHTEMAPLTELLLYNAARAQHVAEVILPALERGDIVITDRFSDSTFAYQGYGRGLDMKIIDQLDVIATGGLRPDLTLLLDLDVATGLRRNKAINKNDRLESEDIAFHEKVRAGFIGLASMHKDRIRLIDASVSAPEVFRFVIEVVSSFIESRSA